MQPNGTCTRAGSQSEQLHWKLHRISSGICIFEGVKTALMYQRIKDGYCNAMVSISLIHPRKIFGYVSLIAIRTDLSECIDYEFYPQILWKLDMMCGMFSLSGVCFNKRRG